MKSSIVDVGIGLSVAISRKGEVVHHVSGVRDAQSGQPVTEQTVFEAASLSKPVVSYAVLQLVETGALDLDEPLARHIPDYIAGDARGNSITTRHVLGHRTGLANWRSAERPLKTFFIPGQRFSYSGEGFVYLQKVVERIMGAPLDEVARDLVFGPLGMNRSSFVWRDHFEDNHAVPHDTSPAQVQAKWKPHEANAAYSLHTTATDYIRFLEASLVGIGLSETSARLWLTPQVIVPRGRTDDLDPDALPDLDPEVAWGLGWGIESDSGTFFQWGSNPIFKAFAMASPREQSALVAFANGAAGVPAFAEIVKTNLPGEHPSLIWLGWDTAP